MCQLILPLRRAVTNRTLILVTVKSPGSETQNKTSSRESIKHWHYIALFNISMTVEPFYGFKFRVEQLDKVRQNSYPGQKPKPVTVQSRNGQLSTAQLCLVLLCPFFALVSDSFVRFDVILVTLVCRSGTSATSRGW